MARLVAMKNWNWKRIGVFLTGVTGVASSIAQLLPPGKVGMAIAAAGGLVAGVAVNAEKFMAKRAKPATPFDSPAAREKVERMKGGQ